MKARIIVSVAGADLLYHWQVKPRIRASLGVEVKTKGVNVNWLKAIAQALADSLSAPLYL